MITLEITTLQKDILLDALADIDLEMFLHSDAEVAVLERKIETAS